MAHLTFTFPTSHSSFQAYSVSGLMGVMHNNSAVQQQQAILALDDTSSRLCCVSVLSIVCTILFQKQLLIACPLLCCKDQWAEKLARSVRTKDMAGARLYYIKERQLELSVVWVYLAQSTGYETNEREVTCSSC